MKTNYTTVRATLIKNRLFGLKLKERISRGPSLRKAAAEKGKRLQGWVIGDRLLQRRVQGETFRSTLYLPRGNRISFFDSFLTLLSTEKAAESIAVAASSVLIFCLSFFSPYLSKSEMGHSLGL